MQPYYTATGLHDEGEETTGQNLYSHFGRSSMKAPWKSASYVIPPITTGDIGMEEAVTYFQGFIDKHGSNESRARDVQPTSKATVVEHPVVMPKSNEQACLTKKANTGNITPMKRKGSTTDFTTLDAIVQNAIGTPSRAVKTSPLTQALHSPAPEAPMTADAQKAQLASISSQMAQTTTGSSDASPNGSNGSLNSQSELESIVPAKRKKPKKAGYHSHHRRIKKTA